MVSRGFLKVYSAPVTCMGFQGPCFYLGARVSIGDFWMCRASLMCTSKGMWALSTKVVTSHYMGPGMIGDCRALEIIFATVIPMIWVQS